MFYIRYNLFHLVNLFPIMYHISTYEKRIAYEKHKINDSI